ncbi:9263_t:CDS:1 [Ambispora leptoticha]|uniref:9263_t:CDS:1 n=1 Tax=Ambispora leptoticha TaxID=144679 RepID=A0A9N9BV37_9GLOM|nr:9263_t:CDS:1 [Ambispora leptoticha]
MGELSYTSYRLIEYEPSYSPYLSFEHFLKIKRDGTYQKKAPNAYFVFRACIVAETKYLNIPIGDAVQISRFTSYHWKMMPKHCKEAYYEISSKLDSFMFPNRQQHYKQNKPLNRHRPFGGVSRKQQRREKYYQIPNNQFCDTIGEQHQNESDQIFQLGNILCEQYQQIESSQIFNGVVLEEQQQQEEFHQISNNQFEVIFGEQQQQNESYETLNCQIGNIVVEQQRNEFYQIPHYQFVSIFGEQQ